MCFVGLSISIREPKREFSFVFPFEVSVYQYPSENQNAHAPASRRTFVSVYQYPSENQNPVLGACGWHCVSVYQYPSENQNYRGRQCPRFWYQFINIHQRTKTDEYARICTERISLSISIREPKQRRNHILYFIRISLSISIREPKPSLVCAALPCVSVYQYPSENQNIFAAVF